MLSMGLVWACYRSEIKANLDYVMRTWPEVNPMSQESLTRRYRGAEMTKTIETERTSGRRVSGLTVVPLIAVALIALLGWGLLNGSDVLPSALLGKPVPEFSLPPVLAGRRVSLRATWSAMFRW